MGNAFVSGFGFLTVGQVCKLSFIFLDRYFLGQVTNVSYGQNTTQNPDRSTFPVPRVGLRKTAARRKNCWLNLNEFAEKIRW